MAGRPDNGELTRVVIVEDTVVFAKTLLHALGRAVSATGGHAQVIDLLGHDEAVARSDAYWFDINAVFLDAYDHARQRTDPNATRFAALDVVDRLSALGKKAPRVIGYSADIERPELNIPFRECDSVAAFYQPSALLRDVVEALWADEPAGQVPSPTPEDYHNLGVSAQARICDAIRRMQSRPDTWELVAQTRPHLGVEPRTREFVNDRVKPLLGITNQSYKPVIRVLQRVTGLPARG